MNKYLINTLLSHDPQSIALVNGAVQLSYGELLQQLDALAKELRSLKVKALALYADNSIYWIVVDLACKLAGIRIIPVPLFFSNEQIQHLISQCGELTAVISDREQETKSVFEIENSDALKSLNAPELKIHFCKNDLLAQLPENTSKVTFTSGSSGQPKGVCLSEANQVNTAQAIVDVLNLETVKHLSLLPLTTLLENIAGVYAPLLQGGTVILPSMQETGLLGSSQLDLEKLLATITHYQPGSLILVPELLMALVTAIELGWQAPESLEFIAVGGAKVSTELLHKAIQLGLPVYEGYGLSECGSVVSLNVPGDEQIGSCGKVLNHCEIKSVNGELIIKGNSQLGYVNEPKSWNQSEIHTGDMGSIDEQGFVHIKGRIKNILISSFGRNINPEWVESKLLANPLIKHAVVFGDAKPYCMALIYPRFSETKQQEIQKIINEANASLPDYARIKIWQLLPEALSIEQNLLTENGRPKRTYIYQRYFEVIENSYNQAEVAVA